MRVWLHEWQGNDSGWSAWSLDHLGFSTWAPSRGEVLRRTPGKVRDYRQWLARHGDGTGAAAAGELLIAEEICGDEVAFQQDLCPAEPEEIARCLALLRFARQDLLAAVEELPDPCLDWDPPYRCFAV
ncbi:MAG: hypothetical protein AB1505_13415 [Candidatus Latescibacterota bacterium]